MGKGRLALGCQRDEVLEGNDPEGTRLVGLCFLVTRTGPSQSHALTFCTSATKPGKCKIPPVSKHGPKAARTEAQHASAHAKLVDTWQSLQLYMLELVVAAGSGKCCPLVSQQESQLGATGLLSIHSKTRGDPDALCRMTAPDWSSSPLATITAAKPTPTPATSTPNTTWTLKPRLQGA